MNAMLVNFPVLKDFRVINKTRTIMINDASLILCKKKDVLMIDGFIDKGLINIFAICKIELLVGEDEQIVKSIYLSVFGKEFSYMCELAKNILCLNSCKIRISLNGKIIGYENVNVY